MQRIGIVGAGQAGLQLGLGLRARGYDVVLVSNQTGSEIGQGRVTSSQCMFNQARQTERELGIALWDDTCPDIEGIAFRLVPSDGTRGFDWAARLDAPAQSVDQRVKIPRWMAAFEAAGGELRIADAGIEDLEALAVECDLVLVAAGKGEIGRLFERDASRSPFPAPMRALALSYVNGLAPRDEFTAVSFNLIPGVGEYFVFPALTTTGPCEIMVFEGVPGGPMDCWSAASTPDEHLATSLAILKRFAPQEHERCADVTLTDPNGRLTGRFAPTVRRPVLTLPSGRHALGMADVVCLNDPITGQGANNAAKCAHLYLEAIEKNGSQAFTAEWMQATFDAYWSYARHVVEWTNALLVPPAPQVVQLLAAGSTSPGVARWIANGFDDPRMLSREFLDERAAAEFLSGSA